MKTYNEFIIEARKKLREPEVILTQPPEIPCMSEDTSQQKVLRKLASKKQAGLKKLGDNRAKQREHFVKHRETHIKKSEDYDNDRIKRSEKTAALTDKLKHKQQQREDENRRKEEEMARREEERRREDAKRPN